MEYYDKNFDPSCVIDTDFKIDDIKTKKKGVYEAIWEETKK